MSNHTMKKPFGILCDVFINLAFSKFLANYVILDYEVHFKISIILRRRFIDMGRALVDMLMG